MSFEKNVFINCPFDEEYFPLLKVLLYVLKRVGLTPRISLERSDSSEVRLAKIQELIESSKYSIHDLSRSKSKEVGEYSRLNMPFELGVDLGCKNYKLGQKYRSKIMLILEEERYSTQKSLSDVSFADCKCHQGDAEELVMEVRNWLSEAGLENLPSATSLWDDYNIFFTEMSAAMMEKGFKQKDINRLPMREFMNKIEEHALAINN